jgi:plastocyanin
MLRMARRAALLATIFALLLQGTAHAAVKEISIVDFSFSPASVNLAVGGSGHWTNNGTFTHTSTSDGFADGSGITGVGLWKSANLAHSADFTFLFFAAGTFPYHCSIHTTMHGTVLVKPKASPREAVQGTIFKIVIATQVAPSDLVYDVQRKVPGGSFQDFMTGITNKAIRFDSTGQPTGTYGFRVLVRRLSTGLASGFSPAVSIMVDPA